MLRVWNIINPPGEPTYYPAKNVNHGKCLIEALAESQLLQREVVANVFGLEIYKDGDWEEWENEEGETIEDLTRED